MLKMQDTLCKDLTVLKLQDFSYYLPQTPSLNQKRSPFYLPSQQATVVLRRPMGFHQPILTKGQSPDRLWGIKLPTVGKPNRPSLYFCKIQTKME
ncbi:hypothetical protein B5X24_HaOG212611 [Helicoverpa armigera]|nr:hypothetical protein B5X24_HaOG212611 [Helicoverpa armigera]